MKDNYKNRLEVLHDIFDEVIDDYPYINTGNNIILRFGDKRRIKIGLETLNTYEQWGAIKFQLMDKENGNIDTTVVVFDDTFDSSIDLNHPNKIHKHVWKNRGFLSWYGKPTEEDYKRLQKELNEYISAWE